MSILPILVVSAAGYLLGAISFAVIIGKARGIDVLAAGSGNPGATNVKRLLGARAGNTVFFLDALKGTVAAAWPLLFGEALFAGTPDDLIGLSIIGAIAAIIGHSFSVFIRFRGGKGVAVTMGGLVVILPVSLVIGLLVWWVTFKISRYVSLASILFALSLPVSTHLLGGNDGTARATFATAIAVLIVYRHRSNIARLVQGTEHRFEKSTASATTHTRNG